MEAHFHIPERYFLSHSVGCQPKIVEQALKDNYLGPWASGRNWQDWMPVLDEFRQGMADRLGVTSDTICPQVTVSSALTKILHSQKPTAKRNRILLSRQAFPTIGFVVKQAERAGYELRFIEGDVTDPQSWADGLDETVAFVHATHALSNSSHILPIKEICGVAKTVGAQSIIDVAQSIGVVSVRPLEWGADFIIGTGVKFLCFGPGACFLYVAKENIALCEPIDVGWFSHEKPFEMEIENFRFAKDAMRFFGGTPSPAPFIAATAVMKVWNEIGFENIQNLIEARLDILCAAAPENRLISPRDAERRGGTCVVNPIERDVVRVRLEAENIHYDERVEGFRFSVHGYTPLADCEALAAIFRASL